jgi:hypothetical protein
MDQEMMTINQEMKESKLREKQFKLQSDIQIMQMCQDMLMPTADDRDKMMLSDWRHNIAIVANRKMLTNIAESATPVAKEDHGIPISTLVVEYLGRAPKKGKGCPGTILEQRIGRSAAKYYRETFKKEPPTRTQLIDGAPRNVKHYREDDRVWLTKIVHKECDDIKLVR